MSGDVGRKRRLKDITQELPSREEFEAYIESLENMDGRSSALSATAFLDVLLGRAVATHFYLHDRRHYSDLFEGINAPLRSFSAKIIVAAGLQILDPHQRKACDRLRSIRNSFAHSIKLLNFETPEVAEECTRIDLDALVAPRKYQPDTGSPRERFNTATMVLGGHLMTYMIRRLDERTLAAGSALQASS